MAKRKSQNRLSMALVLFVMFVILGVVGLRAYQLHRQLDQYTAKKESLQAQIDAENQRTEEIAEYGKYTQTDEYVEEVAREKLGLVKKDEIIFKSEDAGQ
ncbi:MAG: septum formation initiator family protein [Lachnospiraceae bacterium]|jgi:cell division protein DivIC|nr:septum formation initiator family protein [Lachnospiraceae bacterium]MCI1398231.1 septum formation initiator family protein [Lachnospiraceae bacterium]MCI1423078.1 septum formation initiator family protein [Lachnospiraceae bacterium]MCI1451941.1 septum formation initiator family protein [Lachnospiraceae bacterium]MDD5849827.1 septum formation initiator family protein [Bacillota bacterium]